MKKIAFIVGHSLTAQGATNYLNESEYRFNFKVAEYVCKYFNYKQVTWFVKTDNYILHVKAFNPDLIIELHFNAFSQPVFGCESLCLQYPNRIKISKNFNEEFSKRFNIKNRGTRILSSKHDRGFRNLQPFTQYNMFIFEPCFANFKTSDSVKIIENWQNYAHFLIDYCNYYLGYEKRVTKNPFTNMIDTIQSWFK